VIFVIFVAPAFVIFVARSFRDLRAEALRVPCVCEALQCLRLSALEQKLAAIHVHRDAEWRQEFVTNDATELESQEDAGCA
jgi:hypothetical protein